MIRRSKTSLAVWLSLVLAMLAIWLPYRSSDVARRPKKPKVAVVQTSDSRNFLPEDFDAPCTVNIVETRTRRGIAQPVKQNPVVGAISSLVEEWIEFFTEGQITPVEDGGIIGQVTSCDTDACPVAPHPLRSQSTNALIAPEFWGPGPIFSCASEPVEYAAFPQDCGANISKGERTLPFSATQLAAIVTTAQQSAPDCQILFRGPKGTQIRFQTSQPETYDSEALTCPVRHNLPSATIHRLRLTGVPGHPNLEFYPTLEIGPVTPRTEAFLAHNAIPIQFEEEDFNEARQGEFVSRVVYLPDPDFQESPAIGVATLVSTQLYRRVDPIFEADRRGAILSVLRLSVQNIQKTVCEPQVSEPLPEE